MIYLIIFVLLSWVWIIADWISAPHLDDNGNIIKKNDSSTQSNDTNSQEN